MPYGNAGAWAGGLVTLGWIVLGSWIAVFPDTIENVVGAGYNFQGYWGISRLRFEVFTIGTLVVIAAIGIVGYMLGAATRAAPVDVPLAPGVEPSAET
jgi:hypothetical protein